jgi:hypothetical protein
VKGEKLGNTIKVAIIEKPRDDIGRWTQQRVADAAALSKDHLSRVINGKSEISIEKLTDIAVVLNVCFVMKIGTATVIVNQEGGKKYELD